MSQVSVQRWITPNEYLEFEQEAEEKHEYINGEIYAMAGASFNHGRLALNLARLIGTHLVASPCEASGSGVRVYNPTSGSYFYPDFMILCDKPIFKGKGQTTVTNPLIVIEILSPSTEAFDRDAKFAHYQLLPSLEVYSLISQKEPKVEVYTRQNESDDWEEEIFEGMESVFMLRPIEFSAPLSEVYQRVEFPLLKPIVPRLRNE